jgi:hypothetical protein
MRRRAIIGALLLIGVGVVLGMTVFRTDIAQATGLAQSVTVDNTAANPVPVKEQNLDGGNIKVHEEGTVAVRSANQEVSITRTYSDPSGFCFGDLYTVPTGSNLVIEYAAGGAQVGSASESGYAQIFHSTNPVIVIPIPLRTQGGTGFAAGSEAVHYVVPAGTTLEAGGLVDAAGCNVTVSMGGYLQPSP